MYLEKVICQKLLQVSSREEYKLQFCTLLLPVTFCQQIFGIFLNSFEISVKFWVFWIPIFKFCEYKVFRSYQHFFETLKPYPQETAQNFEKRFLQKGLRIAFYTYIPVNLHHILKKHHNHCTLHLYKIQIFIFDTDQAQIYSANGLIRMKQTVQYIELYWFFLTHAYYTVNSLGLLVQLFYYFLSFR